jgi:hypothetical protein
MPAFPDDARAPLSSLIFGIGPMLPLVAAGIGAWALPRAWPLLAVQLAIVWAATILAFIGGVRRGYGFGRSLRTSAEIVASALDLLLAVAALLAPRPSTSLAILVVGFALAALLDRRAALAGDAPAHFAGLRPPQLLLGAAGLAGCWAWLLH